MRAAAAPLQRECCAQLHQSSSYRAVFFPWDVPVALSHCSHSVSVACEICGCSARITDDNESALFMVKNPVPLFSRKNPG